MTKWVAAVVLALAGGPGVLWAGPGAYLGGSGQLGWVATTVAPQIRCLGGQVTGDVVPYCSADTQRIFGFSEQQIWWPETLTATARVAPLLTGPITFAVNCSFDPQYRGPCWGTFAWEVAGGTWKGHWTMPVMDLMTYESELHMVGVGEGGEIDGLQLKLDGSSNPGDWYVAFDVRLRK